MSVFMTLLNLACGHDELEARDNRAERLQLIIAALLASLVFASLWGMAAGSRSLVVALANIYKLPMVVLLSSLSAVPAGLLCWKLVASPYRATDLLTAFSVGVFSGTLVLAVIAPLVALYYHSSGWAGPVLGIGSVFASLLIGTLVFVRAIRRRMREGMPRLPAAAPVAVLVFFQLATLIQLISIAQPIMPELTVFDGGIDRLVPR